MKVLLIYGTILFFTCCQMQRQITIEANYVGYQFQETQNKSFFNKELLFLSAEDTVKVNLRLPIDRETANIIDRGIFHNCHLEEGTKYVVTLKKICVNTIHESENSYYKTNAIFRKKGCSKFKEIKKDTKYRYSGNYGKYVDIEGVLYEIVGLSPSDDCFW